MRLLFASLCLLLICGCIQPKTAGMQTAQAPVYYDENFSLGMNTWTVTADGGGTMEVSSHPNLRVDQALEMHSQMMKSAYAQAPPIRMDWAKDYDVSFDYMLPHRDNFGYTVYRDRNANLVLGEASGVFCNEAGKQQLIGRLDTNVWNRIEVRVMPADGIYDVYFNNELKRSCKIEPGDESSFLVGDTDPSDTVYGDGLWDNFKITGAI